MSKINIQGIINNISSKTNIYTSIIEAIVNSIDSIVEGGKPLREVVITLKRETILNLDDAIPSVVSIEIEDNGVGFNKKNRDSFDTFYSSDKKETGGKGFGRFMFLKYFTDVRIESIYQGADKAFFCRTFNFGKQFDIITHEVNTPTSEKTPKTKIYLNNIIDEKQLDKGLETISRKLLERLLIFFVDEKFNCPKITIKEADGSNYIILNDYVTQGNEIKLVANKKFNLQSSLSNNTESFDLKIFKIYYGNQRSKISLAAHNREVTETSLQSYIPEFEDDFYDTIVKGTTTSRKNYVIKAYILGDYLNRSVSLERETFNFDKTKSDKLFEFSQIEIEREASELAKESFENDVMVRRDRKKAVVNEYVRLEAPWHRSILEDVDFSNLPYNLNNEDIELQLQKIKFKKEQETKKEIADIINSDEEEFMLKLNAVISKVTENGKNDLAHYVCNRKIILQAFEELLKRRQDGSAELEKQVHEIIFPMGRDSETLIYEDHNLWLLDERLVFSEYIASDRKISKQRDALGEPDLVIFNKKKSFRNGDNEFSNPLTIFEFKRPKRDNYKQEDDPILQVGNYLEDIRAGKYEMPEGLEKIKVNDSTPVYGYIVCDITPKIQQFAKIHQLTLSADEEGYFGFHTGFRMYIEIFSFKKLLKDATLRNKIFFKHLGLE